MINPTTVEFLASPNHDAVNQTVPVLSRYDVEIYRGDSLVKVQPLGKPTPDTNTKIVYDRLGDLLASVPAGDYVVKVSAVGPGGIARSASSDLFTVTAPTPSPRPPGTPVVRGDDEEPPGPAGILPASVYAQWADPQVSTITMPRGTYLLPGDKPLHLLRSNVTVNFVGCTLKVNPADVVGGMYPVQVRSVPDTSKKYLPASPTGNDRTMSLATGVITPTTTTLTMEAAEVVALAPGERVLVWAGVNTGDPSEPQELFVATVASVNAATRVVTFTAPFGRTITNHGTAAALRALVSSPEQQAKIGVWGTYPTGANFAKGFGADHGLERFVGGLVHDVTFNDPTFQVDDVTQAAAPNGMWCLSVLAVERFAVNRTTISNPHGSAMHFWRTFGTVVDGVILSGVGSAKIWNGDIANAWAFSMWGGDGLTFKNVAITGQDIAVFNSEVGAQHITLDGLAYDVTFTAARTYAADSTIVGVYSTNSVTSIRNVRVKATKTGGPGFAYCSYVPFRFGGTIEFSGPALTAWFVFNPAVGVNQFLDDDAIVTIGGVAYGPPVVRTWTETIAHTAPDPRDILIPGLVTSATVAITQVGDLRAITDSFGQEYWRPNQPLTAKPLAANTWHQIGLGPAALTAYTSKKIQFWQHHAGSVADATVEIAARYLPPTVP